MVRLNVILLIMLAAVGCDQRPFGDRYALAVRSGFVLIPESVQLDQMYEACDHMISSGPSPRWTSVAYFKGRYVLSMQAPVEVKAAFDEITEVVGEKTFRLWEVGEVSEDGREASIRNDIEISATDFEKLRRNKGDFSVIGIELVDEPVPGFDKFQASRQRNVVPIKPATK